MQDHGKDGGWKGGRKDGQAPLYGRAETLEPGLRRVLARNPSGMTFQGTNSYILGEGAVAVIDPGPDDPAHLAALLGALGPGERVSHILVTHAHRDHSGLARALARATGAPVLAFGDAQAGRRPLMQQLAAAGGLPGGEGADAGFVPDLRLADGARIEGQGWALSAHHTPGHFGNHLCLAWGDAIFSGDHVMGWSSSVVAPPDGDMGAYMASLHRLAGLGAGRLYPGHGRSVEAPATRIAALIRHREGRALAILNALEGGPSDARTLAAAIYVDTPAALMPAAALNVFSQLIDLEERNQVRSEGGLRFSTRFRLA